MERLAILAPALILASLALMSFAVYCVLCFTGRAPQVTGLNRRKFSEIIGPFLTRYALWVIAPLERTFVRFRIDPNALTFASLLVCAGAGGAIAGGWLATGAWLYVFAGLLDILDGRLARATNQQTKAGAFLDSVADRWGELFVFTGFAWLLRSSPWLPVVMFAVAGSIMVSYTRARGEALGVKLDGGTMQRAERIALVAIGLLLTAIFNAAKGSAVYGDVVIGVSLLTVGLASTGTALYRWAQGYRRLRALERAEKADRATTSEPAAEPAGANGRDPRVAIESEHRPAA